MRALEPADCAQTNVALYNQLLEDGWPEPDLLRTRHAYELAAELFAGRFRPMGKPFVCHLVGVASLLARFGAQRSTVVAGLIHSAYPQGDFGTGRQGPLPAHRDRVRGAVGTEVEALVERYARMKGAGGPIPFLGGRRHVSDEVEREVLLIDLMDTLEEHQDYGVLFSRKAGSSAKRESTLATSVAVAELLGRPDLAEIVRATIGRTYDAVRPAVLATDRGVSFTLGSPRRNSPIVRLLRGPGRALQRVRRLRSSAKADPPSSAGEQSPSGPAANAPEEPGGIVP